MTVSARGIIGGWLFVGRWTSEGERMALQLA
jgi:hypothetical protein